jgi:lipopolysaccharide exporter
LLVMRELQLSLRQLLDVLWRPIAAAAFMLVVGTCIQVRWLSPAGLGQNVTGLLILTAVGGATYVGAVAGLWWLARRPPGAERTIVSLIKLGLLRSI